MVNKTDRLSIRNQCRLLSVHMGNLYYKPVGESEENLRIMRHMDEHYLKHPTAGVLRMRDFLLTLGLVVNHKRVRRLLRLMGLMAIDLTYIPMANGFMYLTAIIDVYSRYIVGWGISNSLEAKSVLNVLEEAISRHGKPEIINSDQGSQFTCDGWIEYLEEEKIKISMDGKGRAIDNIFIERFWRSVKYDYVYIFCPEDGLELYAGLKEFMDYYNNHQRHQGIDEIPFKKYSVAA